MAKYVEIPIEQTGDRLKARRKAESKGGVIGGPDLRGQAMLGKEMLSGRNLISRRERRSS
jgi:hypothetical protein